MSGTFSGDGAGLTDINAATATNLVGVAVSNLVQEVRRVFYVGTNGNDSTAIINNPNFPWAANLNTNGVVFGLATNAGDSVYLLPGTYQVNSIPMATGTIFEGTSRESVLLVMTNLWDVSISSFIPSDNCQLRNFSWVATNTGWTSFMMNYPTPSFTNVLIDNLNIYADYDTFYHGPDGQPNDATYKLTIQNSTIRAVWDLLVPNCQGSFQSFNNVYIADNLTTEDFYGTGIGSNVFCTRITTPLMEFDDWGSRFYGFGKTNISNSAWWGFGGRASLHGSVFYCGFTNQLPLPTGYAGSTSIQVSGDYIDGNTGIPYSWGPDKAGWQVDSITTNVLIILDTNHVIITQSEIDAFNGTNTWNADIGAWTNGTTVLIISGGYGEIGTGPAATLDGTESYDTDGGLPVPIYGLQTTAWTTSDGTASALQTRFMTNGTTEVYATNYYPVIFGGGVNQRNGTVNFSGNGNAVTNIPLTGLQAMPLTNNQAGVALDGTFSGDGGGLTNLNASNLAGGTVSDALLSANVPLLNGNQTFGGSNNFAGVVTATNANNTLNGTFTGNVNGTVTGDLVGPASLATNFIGSLSGDVTGTQGATVVSGVGGQTAADVAAGAVLANAATSNNTAGAIVRRDASGNFAGRHGDCELCRRWQRIDKHAADGIASHAIGEQPDRRDSGRVFQWRWQRIGHFERLQPGQWHGGRRPAFSQRAVAQRCECIHRFEYLRRGNHGHEREQHIQRRVHRQRRRLDQCARRAAVAGGGWHQRPGRTQLLLPDHQQFAGDRDAAVGAEPRRHCAGFRRGIGWLEDCAERRAIRGCILWSEFAMVCRCEQPELEPPCLVRGWNPAGGDNLQRLGLYVHGFRHNLGFAKRRARRRHLEFPRFVGGRHEAGRLGFRRRRLGLHFRQRRHELGVAGRFTQSGQRGYRVFGRDPGNGLCFRQRNLYVQ